MGVPTPAPSAFKRHACVLPDGTVLAYRRWGAGPPVYLIHGGPGGSGAYWPDAVPWLGDRHTVFAIDLRGHGASSRTPPYRLAQLARDLDAFAEAHGHDAPALVGHSLGALVVLEAALRSPRFSRLVLIGGWPSTWRMLLVTRGFWTKLRLGASLAGWNLARLAGRRGPPRPFLRKLLRQAAPLFHGASKRAEEVDEILWSSVLDPLDAVAPLQRDLLLWDVSRRLPGLQAETLVLAGVHDGVATAAAPRLARAIPHARLAIMDDAGHSPFFDRPQAFRDLVEPFLGATLTRSTTQGGP